MDERKLFTERNGLAWNVKGLSVWRTAQAEWTVFEGLGRLPIPLHFFHTPHANSSSRPVYSEKQMVRSVTARWYEVPSFLSLPVSSVKRESSWTKQLAAQKLGALEL